MGGWSEESWNCDYAQRVLPSCGAPASEQKDWDDLAKDEKQGAKALGFAKDAWDCVGESCNFPKSEDKAWKELSKTEKMELASLVGISSPGIVSLRSVQRVSRMPLSPFGLGDSGIAVGL